MKTIEIEIYSASEMKEKSPEGFERALEKWRENVASDPAWIAEIADSFKSVFAAAGLRLTNWAIGGCGTDCTVAPFFGESLTGGRAWAWLENNLLGKLRIPWSGPGRWSVAKYGRYYRPGLVRPCPLTGVCFDDDLLDDLRDSIRAGLTVKNAFEALADKAFGLIEHEIESQQTEEYFLETSESNGYEYTADGNQY